MTASARQATSRDTLLASLETSPTIASVAHALAWLIKRDDEKEREISRLVSRVSALENAETYRATSNEAMQSNVLAIQTAATQTAERVNSLLSHITPLEQRVQAAERGLSRARLIAQSLGAALVVLAFELWKLWK